MNGRWIYMLVALASFMAGCDSHIRPLRPLQRVEVWVPDEAGTRPAAMDPGTMPAATTMASTEPATAATQPGKMVVKIVDPNETSRYIYKASYDTVWQQAGMLLTHAGFALDDKDYRLGVLTTLPLPGAQVIEFWKPQHTGPINALENTIHSQRRIVRVTISHAVGKPDFYEIGVQVLVARERNPNEELGGPIFIEGSGFGRNVVTLRSDFADPKTFNKELRAWEVIGHDPDLEKKLIDALFQRI